MTGDGPFRDPGLPDGERAAYRGTIDRREAGSGELRLEASPDRYVQRIAAELEGGYGLELEMSFARVNGTLRAEHYRLDSNDGERPVAHEEGWAWRVDVAPRFDAVGTALNRVIAALLPPFRVHFEAAEPHRFLRFSFPTGPFPWNPRGLIEATELSAP